MTETPKKPGRRRLVLGGVGFTALVAGAGVALWHQQNGQDASGAEQLWALQFDTPHGEPLAMARLRGKPLLLNFWATWCPPCVEEMPLLDAFFRKHAANGWQVVGLAIDQPSAVRKFLQRTPVTFPVGFAGLEGSALTKALGNLSGGLPFTVVVGSDGSVRHRRMGQVSEQDLQQWASLR